MPSDSNADPIRMALAWTSLVVLAYLVYRLLEPFLVPLGWGGVLAVVFYPLHEQFARRWGAARASSLTTLTATAVVIVPAMLVMTAFAREAIDASALLQRAMAEDRLAWIERIWEILEERIPVASRVNLAQMAATAAQQGARFVVSQAGFVLRDLAAFLFNVILSLFTLFFLLRDSEAIMRAIRRLMPVEDAMREELLARTRQLISVGVVSSVIVAAIQGLLGGLVFAILRIDAPVFWGVVMALLCLLPFGAWVVWLPAAAVLLLNGEFARGLILVGLGFGIVSAADNVLRPLLLSGSAQMNGLVIFLSLVGGIAVFGLLGIVLGPVLIATALALVSAYIDSVAREAAPAGEPPHS